jgi:uridine kinase
MDKGTRTDLLDRLAEAIESVTTPHPLRVAVDGPPAAGKTTLADELALLLRTRGREVIRATTESFHLPRAQRYRRGEFSPEANYYDSFDYDALRQVLLDPLGPDGDQRYQHAVYDLDTDTALSPPVRMASADAVLLLDGVFLLRPELIDRWDLSIFVSAPFEQTLDRARRRDLARLGSAADVERRFRSRYIPAQKLYFAAASPADQAGIIVHNDDPRQPAWELRLDRLAHRPSPPHSSVARRQATADISTADSLAVIDEGRARR